MRYISHLIICILLSVPVMLHAQEKNKDWAQLQRYDSANRVVKSWPASKRKVVFTGDSITDFWITFDSAYFREHPYIDRGINAQTSGQMLVRFRNDVINLEPKAVVILAGTNDVAENNGPTTLETIAGNIASMAELAKAHHIKVVICSVLPATDFWWHKGLEPAGKIIRLNEMLKAYALKNKFSYVDYHTEMKDASNGLDKMYSDDGVHPTPVGYRKMEEILERTLVRLVPVR